jgi:hypothetical protein
LRTVGTAFEIPATSVMSTASVAESPTLIDQ